MRDLPKVVEHLEREIPHRLEHRKQVEREIPESEVSRRERDTGSR